MRAMQIAVMNGSTLDSFENTRQPLPDEYSGYLEYLRQQGTEVLWLNEENEVTGIPES